MARLAGEGITLEVCPLSNVGLGVYADAAAVPLRALYDAGVQLALGADDPLLFGSRLVAQYRVAREHHDFSDADLAELARMSVRGSTAPDAVRAGLLTQIDTWLSTPPDSSD